jgi:hypothetical protein
MKQVWVGMPEVSQIPGDQLIQLRQGAAFAWFTCWADSPESYEQKAAEVMLHYGLNVIGAEQVSSASDRTQSGEELLEQIRRTGESETHSLYGTFHGYPPRYF